MVETEIASSLARSVIDTNYGDLPAETVAVVKQHILHTLAAALGGGDAPGCKMVVDVVREWGGKAEGTVLVYGGKVPAVNAALANSTMAHARDFCCNDDRTFYKTSVVVIPAVLAAAEKRGGVTGRELITAACLGIELGIRIALAIVPSPAHALSPMIGSLASAAGVARILGLDQEQVLDALGIAYCQVSASGTSTTSPALTKRLGPGLAAKAGVFSAELALKGFKGVRKVLQGPTGYFCTYHGVEGNLESLAADLGRRWEIVEVGPKGYPCCRRVHGPIDATLALVREHDLRAEDVEAVNVRGSRRNLYPSSAEATPETQFARRHPRGVVDAQFSIPWGVATALLKRKVFIEDFSEEALEDGAVQRMADAVTLTVDPLLDNTSTMVTPVVVELRTRGGQTLSHRVDFPKGNPRNPVDVAETRENFRKCAARAAEHVSPVNAERALDLLDHLEEIDDVGRLPEYLSDA